PARRTRAGPAFRNTHVASGDPPALPDLPAYLTHPTLLNDLPLRVADLHGAQIELAQLGLDFRAIPDGDHDELVRDEIFFRHRLGLRRRDRVDASGIVREVVQTQIVDVDVREAPCRARAALEGAR